MKGTKKASPVTLRAVKHRRVWTEEPARLVGGCRGVTTENCEFATAQEKEEGAMSIHPHRRRKASTRCWCTAYFPVCPVFNSAVQSERKIMACSSRYKVERREENIVFAGATNQPQYFVQCYPGTTCALPIMHDLTRKIVCIPRNNVYIMRNLRYKKKHQTKITDAPRPPPTPILYLTHQEYKRNVYVFAASNLWIASPPSIYWES